MIDLARTGPLLALGLGFALTSMSVLWLVSLRLRDSSIVDVYWGLGLGALYWIYALAAPPLGARTWLMGAAMTIWSVRLALHIFARNRGSGEDPRYARWRAEAGSSWWWLSLFKVFLLQGAILWVISFPAAAVQTSPRPLNALDWLALVVWTAGFLVEMVADLQLARFLERGQGGLMTEGLWRYSRHPNYFGEALLWWGFTLFAAAAGAWWTVISPLLMTYLLRFVSGVPILEERLKGKPGFEEYARRTPIFVPGRPAGE